ncbi:fused adenylate cyclase/two component hybrid sensor/regulator [Legionella rubrilucens]|uniref:Fused adenylate cyclase/two component hybrid sensor/regulator n=1 Tax=Legionella rubrilucens TaxID=458 RepID=A0A0W0XML4_9GAMM|nr:sensor domain-containing diguanylate cyclase [Legionella rubrilucens]KTD45618.1 fused adenylate cyclase/two component hybrid sensor/regulator [Legionella rubrilucens]
MIKPKVHPNEAERLKALHATGLINTPMEQGFEQITSLTKKIFDVPIVAISLIDKDKQWFKSIIGSNLSETPREISFCGHTILKEEALIVSDAQSDARFKNNPLVTGEKGSIRFYAGYPIHASNDHQPIGALCIIDNKPRHISPTEKSILHDLAALVDSEISNFHSLEAYKARNFELECTDRITLLDGVTKTWNANGITQLLQQQMKLSKEEKETFGLFNVSIDSFNSFTEEYGEEVGNELLHAIARNLVVHCHNEASIGYLGGKEFMVILPLNDKREILKSAERLRQNIEHEPMTTQAGEMKATITIGIVFYDPHVHQETSSIMTEAHGALEEGRHAGGNRIVLH